MRDEELGTVAELGAIHSKRREYIRLLEIAKRLAAHPRDDAAEEVIAPIVVLPFCAGREVHSLLTGEHSHYRLVLVLPRVLLRQSEQAETLAQSTRVGEQLTDGHVALAIDPPRDILADFIVERQLAAVREQQDAHGRELFRDRRGAQYGIGGNRHA
jgi:hypothetical protein